MEVLSPFSMLDLSEDEVALLNNKDNLITSSSLVSVADLRQQRKQKKVYIPAGADEFMLVLKCYANLVYAVFSETCPLFKVLREVIIVVRGLYYEDRKCTTMATKGYILWIVLLQSKRIALVEVNILCEFATMHGNLRAKRATINNSEIPLELLTHSTETPSPPAIRSSDIQVVDTDKTHNS